MKKALITGITGMVGSHLADYLLAHTDWNIDGMIRWRSSLDNIEHLIREINKKNRLKLLYGELRDYISLEDVLTQSKPDYIFHLAAQSYPKTSFESPIDTMDTNILGTSRLLDVVRKMRVRDPNYSPVIHVCASSEVFGRVDASNLPIKEDCTFHPASPYAISKVGTDLVGRFYAEAYGMTVVTTRMFTHTGPRRGDVFAESTFAKQIAMIEAGMIPDNTIRVGNLDSLRTFADVRDAVRAYHMLVIKNPIAGEYYNIGGTHTCSVRDMLNYLISLSTKKHEIRIEIDPDRLRPIDADLQVPDTSKFQVHTGWNPEIPFEKTMIDLLEWWRHKVSGNKFFLNR